jgi:hypothetical protein
MRIIFEQEDSTKQQNGFRLPTKKMLFQNLNENESCIWTPKRKVSRQLYFISSWLYFILQLFLS